MANSSSLDLLQRSTFLVLGPQDVYPPIDGGKEGIYGAIGALALYSNVMYAYPSIGGDSAHGYSKIGVVAIPYRYECADRFLSILLATLVGRPYKFEKYCSRKATHALNSVVPQLAFTAIICHHAHTYKLARRFARQRGLKVPIVVREHNVEYMLVESYRDTLAGVKRLAASLFAWLTRRAEFNIWRQADAVAFLSDNDIKTAAEAVGPSSCQFFLVSEGVPIPLRRAARHPGSKAALLALLNPRATQSVANLKRFVHIYWLPLRRRHLIENEVLQVTGVTQEQLSGLIELDVKTMTQSGIHALGFLPSLSSTLEGALALVSPTFVGSGIRKKVLEAMAHQLPVIATDFDIASCDYFKPHENILPLGDAVSFASTVKRLREDDAYWLDLSTRARDTVEQFANWKHYGNEMYRVIESLIIRQQ